MTRTPVIVTGGAGYIGSHACKSLAAAGYLPVTVDNLGTGHADAVKWGPLERADVRDTGTLTEIISRYGARAVMNFAASAYVGESVAAPDAYYDNNVGGLISVLSAMKAAGADLIVQSSSCATYGIPAEIPIREDAPQNPVNPYGRTKLVGEMMIRDHAEAFGLRYAILRYFNAAGADPDGELAERHDPETHLIPLALAAAAGTGPALRVFGRDYPTPDGTCIRDYIHVADLAAAHLAALGHLGGGGDNLTLNLGTGQGLSILEICAAITRVTGKAVPLEDSPRRPGDPPVLVADASEAARRLGFRPQHSRIEVIVRDAARHFGLQAVAGHEV